MAEYDKQIKRTLPFYEEMFQQVVDIVRILNLQSLRWLDVGCGTGKMARTVLDNFDIQKMVCIDVENEMLERAESFCDAEKVEFLQCDVRELPYQEMFDIVTAIQVNHYFRKAERIAIIKNCYDALAENGIYIFFENFAPDSEEGTGLYLERWKEFQIANGKTKEEAYSHIGRYGRDYFPISISESIGLLKNCGFRMVEILWVSYMQVGILARK
jgi:tRNA (cmo5U34)-methyltransferase